MGEEDRADHWASEIPGTALQQLGCVLLVPAHPLSTGLLSQAHRTSLLALLPPVFKCFLTCSLRVLPPGDCQYPFKKFPSCSLPWPNQQPLVMSLPSSSLTFLSPSVLLDVRTLKSNFTLIGHIAKQEYKNENKLGGTYMLTHFRLFFKTSGFSRK